MLKRGGGRRRAGWPRRGAARGDPALSRGDVFDYIIIGAGAAGCVLASRLTEDPAVRALLIEAGGSDHDPRIHVPAAFPELFKSRHDWIYFTEPEPGMDCRRLYWPRGKVVGGSTSINAMVYVRGSRHDFDTWRALGNEGWGFDDVLPYFKKAEDQERGPSELHGVGGPMRVSDLRCVSPLSRAFVDAAAAAGLPRNDDFNGPEQDGAGIYQVTQRRGARESAATAYLRPALFRPGLALLERALVTRVVLEGRRAAGVEYAARGELCRVRAEREVLLCAGTVGSAQLLLLSGIGPAAALRALGVPVAADLPGVGEGLEDHLGTPVVFECTQPITLADAARLRNYLLYALLRRGPLTSNLAEAGGFARTRPGLPAPDLQLYFSPAYYVNHGLDRPPGHWFTTGGALTRPRSRGRLSLRTADPRDAPSIDPRYLESDEDLEVLVSAVRLAREIVAQRAFDPYRGREAVPGPEARSDHQIAEHVRRRSETLYHAVGTCRMGRGADAVVDPRLRVRGVEGLRVVDASIMPTIVTGNTAAATVMIAERAADLIRSGAA